MEKSEILENITKSVSERLKVPIVVTYACVLVIFNWDILFYLFFENTSASTRINTIKQVYGEIYYERIFICLTIAVILIVVFTILNTILNLILKWFYRKDRETNSEIENFEKISSLTEQLSKSIENTKRLSSEIENLKNINENLSSKNLDIDITEISENDYNKLLSTINSQADKEKLLYSLKELIRELKKDISVEYEKIFNVATYEHGMKNLIKILENRQLLKVVNDFNQDKERWTNEFKLSKSFKDFLNMKI